MECCELYICHQLQKIKPSKFSTLRASTPESSGNKSIVMNSKGCFYLVSEACTKFCKGPNIIVRCAMS